MAQPCTPLQVYRQDGEYDMEDAEAREQKTKEQGQEQEQEQEQGQEQGKKEEEEEKEEEEVFTRENRGGSAQHATRATPILPGGV